MVRLASGACRHLCKLDSVVTDVTGKAARNMIEALIAGERDPVLPAEMALTRMRPKIPELRRALVGRFNEHHAFPARMHLDRMDSLDEAVAKLDAEVDRVIAPFSDALARLQTIPGVGQRTAEVVVAECVRRFRRRFGAKSEGKALFAVAHTLVVIIWNVLATDEATYVDLGPDWFQQRDDTQAHVRRLVRQLERLGLSVNVKPAA